MQLGNLFGFLWPQVTGVTFFPLEQLAFRAMPFDKMSTSWIGLTLMRWTLGGQRLLTGLTVTGQN